MNLTNAFFEAPSRDGIDMDKYLNEWSKQLFSGRDPASLSQAVRRDESIRIGEKVKTLWKSFNAQRTKLEKHYLDSFDNFQAYNAGFLLPNVQRVYSICRTRDLAPRLERLAKRNGTLKILDFGAGPLSASAGIVAGLAHFPPNKFEINAVERTKRAFDFGSSLLRAAVPDDRRIETRLFTSATKIAGEMDVIIAANVFNEIPLNHRRRTLDSLLEKLSEDGLLIIVEPGQDIHSRALSSLRDSLIENAPFPFEIVAPCLHKKKCPLSSESNRTDWCWSQTMWKPPLVLAELDRYTGLRHVELNFSYLVISKTSEKSLPNHFARIVSDPIAVGGPSSNGAFLRWARSNTISDTKTLLENSLPTAALTKNLLCTTSGRLEAAIGLESAGDRGTLVKEIDVPCRCTERVELTPKETSPSTGGRSRRDTESRSPRSQKARPTQRRAQPEKREKTQKPRR